MGGSVFPSITGALINGIGTNILAGGDTKKGLLMNAALLAGSQGLNPAMGSGGSVANASAMANSQLPTAAFTNTPVVPAINTAPFAMNPYGTPAIGGSSVGGGPSTGMVPSSLATPPGFLDQIGNYAQQNPNLTRMGLQSAQQMMQQPEAQFAPAGQIQRGGIQDVQIASALPQAPRISLI